MVEALVELLPAKPTVVDSGRGYQAWLLVEPDVPRRALLRALAQRVSRPGVRVDPTHDTARLVRLPGTTNSKSGRTAQIVEVGDGRRLTADHVTALGLHGEDEDDRATRQQADRDQPTPADLELLKREALEIWEERGTLDRSLRDFRFVLELLRAGAPEAAACRLLFALPEGKANVDRRGDDYWTSTLASARKRLSEEERLLALAWSLPDRPPDDIYDPEALDALVYVREHRVIEWAKLRGALKRAKVSLGVLEDAMKEHRKVVSGRERNRVRYAKRDGTAVGWFLDQGDEWLAIPRSDLTTWLTGSGLDAPAEIKKAIDRALTLVNVPFAPEHPEPGMWNRGGAQLAFTPAPGDHPTWDSVLAQIGAGLDEAVLEDEWCKREGITTGAAYALAWTASMLQQPAEPTAYLFLFGEEESGKSTFPEALRLLMTRGAVHAKQALMSAGGFNGELAGAVLAIVDDFKLPNRRGVTHDRLKEWVTAIWMSYHSKGHTPYDDKSYLHWVHTANGPDHCPVLDGDTRITMIEVQPPSAKRQKRELFAALRKEGAAFLHTALHLELPGPGDRLAIPSVATAAKRETQRANRDEIETWLDATPAWLAMSDAEIVEAFVGSLPLGRQGFWTASRVRQGIPWDTRDDRRVAATLRRLAPWEGSLESLAAEVGLDETPRATAARVKRITPALEAFLFTVARRRVGGEAWVAVTARASGPRSACSG